MPKLRPEDRVARKVVKFAKGLCPGLTAFQERMVETVWSNRMTAVATGHGIGKGYAGGLLAMLFPLFYDRAMVVITAPTGRQAKRTLWSELTSRLDELKGEHVIDGREVGLALRDSEINQQEWRIGGRTVALHYTAQPDKGTAFQGIHAPALMVLMDEAAGLDDRIIEAATTLATGENSRIVLMGNPTNPGKFQETFRPNSGWATVQSSCFDHPNVVEGWEVVAGAVTRHWISDRWMEHGDGEPLRWQKGRMKNPKATKMYKRAAAHKNPWWMGHVLGEFPPQGEDTLISDEWVRDAIGRRAPRRGHRTAGCDVARYGRDETVVIICDGGDAVTCEAEPKTSGPQVVDMLYRMTKTHDVEPRSVRVDATGLGGMGVSDWLTADPTRLSPEQRAAWEDAEEVEFGGKAEEPERFVNRRAELLWAMRGRFERGEVGLAALDDVSKEALRAELPYLKFVIRGGRYAIESKDEYRKRTGKSPDYAEALALALWLDPYAPAAGDAEMTDEELLESLGVGGVPAKASAWRHLAGDVDEDAELEELERELDELDEEFPDENSDAARASAAFREQNAMTEARRKAREEQGES